MDAAPVFVFALKKELIFGMINVGKDEDTWDKDAAVWVATSDDVPGLALESGSFDALIERVKYAVPELMELNHRNELAYHLNFFSKRDDVVVMNG